ncbi:MAG: OmpH family outer membrane protein [Myxococcales bacterium]|nr:OmpH family outer membrane protein [Myxococcales bacterium]MCB9520603.1 OmpH family outer membrane protein [Myxococcales bacterium]MCB9531526.1 OmpH family outer membrane protein [Myxococcales bacterium]
MFSKILAGAVAGVLAAMLVLPSDAAAQEMTICTVDLQDALSRVEEGRTALSSLTADLDRRQQALDQEQQELAQWMQDLEAQIAVLSPEQREARMHEYEQRVTDLQRSFAASQQELAQAEAAATQRIYDRMVAIVSEYAREHGCTLVLQTSAVIYSASNTDFTDALVTAYDQRY